MAYADVREVGKAPGPASGSGKRTPPARRQPGGLCPDSGKDGTPAG